MTSPARSAPRRELRTRQRAWPRAMAAWLAGRGVTPNAVSVISIFFAATAGYALYRSRAFEPAPLWLLLAAAGIQLRLLCNLLDGLLAVEGGLKSAVGDVYNDAPDRLADVLILVGAGYALAPNLVFLGWLAALLAVITAYVRTLAGSLGATQRFSGPMAKQHRMFALTVGCLAAAAEQWLRGERLSLMIVLAIIVAGSALTIVRRLSDLSAELRAR
ncbi:MAG TPA: CDP-alcohol phosphatidyltransferase family protein [Gemmatimonadaceae bacterium]|nr:CDP-alcohol phosphatidyltransferase family protein [Gemmatimonadaceae bacterium]